MAGKPSYWNSLNDNQFSHHENFISYISGYPRFQPTLRHLAGGSRSCGKAHAKTV